MKAAVLIVFVLVSCVTPSSNVYTCKIKTANNCTYLVYADIGIKVSTRISTLVVDKDVARARIRAGFPVVILRQVNDAFLLPKTRSKSNAEDNFIVGPCKISYKESGEREIAVQKVAVMTHA